MGIRILPYAETSRMVTLSRCIQTLGIGWVMFLLLVVKHWGRLLPKTFRGKSVFSVKLRILSLVAIREALLAKGIDEIRADALTYSVAFAFATHESTKQFGGVARIGNLSEIQNAFCRIFRGQGKHQRISPMLLAHDDTFSFSYCHCEFMVAFNEFGVPTATVGKAFCDADRNFWKNAFIQHDRPYELIKPEATLATTGNSCVILFVKK